MAKSTYKIMLDGKEICQLIETRDGSSVNAKYKKENLQDIINLKFQLEFLIAFSKADAGGGS